LNRHDGQPSWNLRRRPTVVVPPHHHRLGHRPLVPNRTQIGKRPVRVDAERPARTTGEELLDRPRTSSNLEAVNASSTVALFVSDDRVAPSDKLTASSSRQTRRPIWLIGSSHSTAMFSAAAVRTGLEDRFTSTPITCCWNGVGGGAPSH
jgi:hypothetical protein